jgi:hypothetical protein
MEQQVNTFKSGSSGNTSDVHLGQDTNYPDWEFHGFVSDLQGKC